MKRINIGNYWIGQDEPLFIVVETGTTCNGDLTTALQMVWAAKEAGADAIKFQMINPDYFMSDKTVVYDYEWVGGHRSENMYDMFKSLQFTPQEWLQIRDCCQENEITFYATVDYLPGVDLAEEIGVAAYKLGSWDVANYPLIQRMAQTGKPIQVDLGPTFLGDIEKIITTIMAEGNNQILLVHCSHAKTNEGINVRSIPYLHQVFNVPVGFSADSRDFVPDLMAVALGTNMIEKRLTLDRTTAGHHHITALEPHEFKEYVLMLRRAEQTLGEYALRPSTEDLRQKELYFVSIVAETDICLGETITRDKLACKRPGTGISPEFLQTIVGRKAQRNIKRNELLSWDDV